LTKNNIVVTDSHVATVFNALTKYDESFILTVKLKGENIYLKAQVDVICNKILDEIRYAPDNIDDDIEDLFYDIIGLANFNDIPEDEYLYLLQKNIIFNTEPEKIIIKIPFTNRWLLKEEMYYYLNKLWYHYNKNDKEIESKLANLV